MYAKHTFPAWVVLEAYEVKIYFIFCPPVCPLKQLDHCREEFLLNPGVFFFLNFRAFIILNSEDTVKNSAGYIWCCKMTLCFLAVKTST